MSSLACEGLRRVFCRGPFSSKLVFPLEVGCTPNTVLVSSLPGCLAVRHFIESRVCPPLEEEVSTLIGHKFLNSVLNICKIFVNALDVLFLHYFYLKIVYAFLYQK